MKSASHISGLDGLRGIAAICVVYHHLVSCREHEGMGLIPILNFSHGYLAVDFFFILSGFVIARAYEQKLADGLSIHRFGLLRLKRLYPTILIGSMIGYLVALSLGQNSDAADRALLGSALFLPFFTTDTTMFALNEPHWSILFELAVNFIHAMLRPILSNLVLLSIMMTSIIGLAYYTHLNHSLGAGWTRGSWPAALCRTIFGYFSGVLLYRFWPSLKYNILQVEFWKIGFALIIILGVPFINIVGFRSDWRDFLLSFLHCQ
jgi:peptidoglycan/LPS O-acetylase OafA/YrhL